MNHKKTKKQKKNSTIARMASFVTQLVENLPAMRGTRLDPWVGKIPWRRERLLTLVFWPGEFYGLYNPWDRKDSGTTEQLLLSLSLYIARIPQQNIPYSLSTSLFFWAYFLVVSWVTFRRNHFLKLCKLKITLYSYLIFCV